MCACVSVHVCVCALYIEGVFFSKASGLTQRDVEMNPMPLPGFYSLRDIEASHTLELAGSGCVCTSMFLCKKERERERPKEIETESIHWLRMPGYI